MAEIRTLRLDNELAPLAKAVIHDHVVYVSGQAAVDPETMAPTDPDIHAQTRETLRRVEAILHEAGTDKDRLLMVRVYLPDVENDFAAMNEVYGEWLEGNRPARTTVGAALAIPGLRIEVDAIAAVD